MLAVPRASAPSEMRTLYRPCTVVFLVVLVLLHCGCLPKRAARWLGAVVACCLPRDNKQALSLGMSAVPVKRGKRDVAQWLFLSLNISA